jgi:cation diffusion facilitator family transporter
MLKKNKAPRPQNRMGNPVIKCYFAFKLVLQSRRTFLAFKKSGYLKEMNSLSEFNIKKIGIMKLMLLFSSLLMLVKFLAFYFTNSVGILSDALESIINIVAGAFALFSIYYASKPKDPDHPYGHGKIENLSVGFEGALIFIAGLSIIAKAIDVLFHPIQVTKLDLGVILSGIAGACNFLMGSYLKRKGKKYNSILMVADGKHLMSDAVSSLGLIIGLGLMVLTHLPWIDAVIALVFGGMILWTGFKLLRESVFNLLDKTDVEKLSVLTKILQEERRPKWIDMHNLRILKYGDHLHVDAHITLPWYDTLEATHHEIKAVEEVVKNKLGNEIEFFLHPDPCLPVSCPLCTIDNCPVRKHTFEKKIEWTLENLLPDKKHSLDN